MLRIECPYCGMRDFTEFHYGGDATQKMPDLGDENADRWTEYVMFRDNPIGSYAEYWQHLNGCRQWLRVVRDTVSHIIESVTPARDVIWPKTDQEQKSE